MKRGKSLSGTPWHTEFLKKSEDDDRRHKSRCIYYNKGKCSININCYGSRSCKHYREKPREEKEIKPYINSKLPPIRNAQLMGSFALKRIDDNEILCYNIGLDITVNDELVNIIKTKNKNSVFEYNGIKYEIINKNLYYKTNKSK